MYRLADELRRLNELGIHIHVYHDKKGRDGKSKAELLKSLQRTEPLTPEEDGFLIREGEATHFFIIVEVPRTNQLTSVVILGKENKEVSPLTNLSSDDNRYVTVKSVSTYPVYGGYSTMPHDNGLRIISTIGNILKMFQISIASRVYVEEGSLHFLAVQELYHGQLFFDENTSLISIPNEEFPGYANWPSLQSLIEKMVDSSELPRRVVPTVKKMSEITKEGQARVIFFNASNGLGKVLLRGGATANLHWKQLDIEERFPFVGADQLLEYSGTAQKDDGTVQLINVRPVMV